MDKYAVLLVNANLGLTIPLLINRKMWLKNQTPAEVHKNVMRPLSTLSI